jgi:hypothetical protein
MGVLLSTEVGNTLLVKRFKFSYKKWGFKISVFTITSMMMLTLSEISLQKIVENAKNITECRSHKGNLSSHCLPDRGRQICKSLINTPNQAPKIDLKFCELLFFKQR